MVVFRRNGVLVFRNGISVFRKQCFEMDGSVSKHGWQCFGVSGGVSRKCFEVDGSVSVFRNSVSKWMAVFRNGWQCFGVSGGVSRKCFEVDGSVSVFPESISKWMAVFRNGWQCFGVSGKSVSRIVKSGWQCGWQCFGCFETVFPEVDGSVRSGWQCFGLGVSVFRCFGMVFWCFHIFLPVAYPYSWQTVCIFVLNA